MHFYPIEFCQSELCKLVEFPSVGHICNKASWQWEKISNVKINQCHHLGPAWQEEETLELDHSQAHSEMEAYTTADYHGAVSSQPILQLPPTLSLYLW